MKQKAIMLMLCCVSFLTQAQVRLPHIFGDNMVLQREKPVAVWGWANAKEKIKIQFHEQAKTVVGKKLTKLRRKLRSAGAV